MRRAAALVLLADAGLTAAAPDRQIAVHLEEPSFGDQLGDLYALSSADGGALFLQWTTLWRTELQAEAFERSLRQCVDNFREGATGQSKISARGDVQCVGKTVMFVRGADDGVRAQALKQARP